MGLVERWTSFKADEQPILLRSILYIILTSFIKVWLDIVPRSLFLKHYSISTLPFVYGTSSLILIITGLLFSLLERRFLFSQILKLFSYSLTVSFLSIWLGILFSAGDWIYLVAMAVGQAASGVLQVQVWGMLNNLLTLDQAKRMLGLMGICQTLAYILGSLSVPLLNYIIGINNVLFAITLCMAMATIILIIILRKSSKRFFENKRDSSAIKKENKKWIKNHYNFNIFVFCFFSFVVVVVVDFTFNAVSKNEIPNEVKLADFFGYFSAAVYSAQLLCHAFVSRFVIQNFGVGLGLLSRFYLIGIIIVMLAILPLNYVFLLCILLKLIDESFRGSTWRQAYLLLFYPLGPKQGSEFYIKTQLYASPLAMLFTSVPMWLIWRDQKIGLYTSMLFLALTIAINILVGFLLQKGYIKQLKKAIGRRTPQIMPKLYDSGWVAIILSRMSHGYPDEVVYCLDLLENNDKNLFEKGLLVCLQSPYSIVRYHAYQKLHAFKLPSSVPLLEQSFRNESNPIHRSEAFRAFLFQQPNLNQMLQAYLDDPLLMDLAIVAVLGSKQANNKAQQEKTSRTSSDSLKEKALSKLSDLGNSVIQNERLRAAEILAQLDDPQALHFDAERNILEKLLHDEDSQVIKAAIKAAGIFYEDRFYKILVDYLNNPTFQSTVIPVLCNAPKNTVPFLENALKDAWAKGFTKQSKLLVACLGKIKDPRSTTILLHYLQQIEHRTLRNNLVQSLEIANFHTTQSRVIDPFLFDELEYLKLLMHLQYTLKNQPIPPNLYETLRQECLLSEKQIFIFLGFFYNKDLINNIFLNLTHNDSADKAAFALELLENILEKGHKTAILPVIRMIYREQFIPQYPIEMSDVIKKILSMPTDRVTGLVKAIALYLIESLNLQQLVPFVEKIKEDNDFLVSETGSWVLTKLKTKKKHEVFI